MARALLTIESQVTSGGFKFEKGKGKVVSAIVCYDQVGEYDPKCGFRVGIQRLDKNLKPTSDEPVEEFLGAGALEDKEGNPKFHVGKAKSAADEDPEDLGDDMEVEGNCLWVDPDSPAHMDKKAKLAIFSASLQEKGFKPSLLNGYAPNLIGLIAEFDQKLLEKGANFTGKNDPTALIVVQMIKAPYDKKAGAAAPAAPAAPAPPASTKRRTPAPPAEEEPEPEPEQDEVETGAEGEDADQAGEEGGGTGVEETAVQVLVAVGKVFSGQVVPRAKINSRLLTLYPQMDIEPEQHDQIGALVKGDWFKEKAEELGWKLDKAGNVTLPKVKK